MTDQIAARRDMANAIRALAMDAVQQADSGHPGMPMGMADVATVLFTKFMKFDASEPHWPDRDRFILSAGHGSMLLYSLLHLTGYADMTLDELKRFRQLGSKTAGHPEYGHASGIETTTGPLGQGLGNSVGFALAERLMAERFGRDIVDHYTYVITGDGCLMEGVGQEAITLAGHLGLGRPHQRCGNRTFGVHMKRLAAGRGFVESVRPGAFEHRRIGDHQTCFGVDRIRNQLANPVSGLGADLPVELLTLGAQIAFEVGGADHIFPIMLLGAAPIARDDRVGLID